MSIKRNWLYTPEDLQAIASRVDEIVTAVAPDADDFRSSVSHGLAYLARDLKHKPTFELISGWVEGN